MIEKQLIQALEPFISDIEKIEKRIDEIALTPGPQGEAGPAGADAVAPDVEDIAEIVKADEVFISALKGEAGPQGDVGPQGEAGPAGADAITPDIDDIASAAILNERFSEITVDAIKSIMTAKLDEELAEVDAILK